VFKVAADERHKIDPLEGEIPSPLDLPQGCPFASRCEQCSDLCVNNKPQLREIAPGHWVACHKC
jgi:peptide/nickel transport system ATP-binding protein